MGENNNIENLVPEVTRVSTVRTTELEHIFGGTEHHIITQ